MTELQINLSISALTLVVACGIGVLADGLSGYLDNSGNASPAVEETMFRTNPAASTKNIAVSDQPTVPASDSNKVAMK